MPVEIRELNIKGHINHNSSTNVFNKMNEPFSPLMQTEFANKLKKDIVNECLDRLEERIERKNRR